MHLMAWRQLTNIRDQHKASNLERLCLNINVTKLIVYYKSYFQDKSKFSHHEVVFHRGPKAFSLNDETLGELHHQLEPFLSQNYIQYVSSVIITYKIYHTITKHSATQDFLYLSSLLDDSIVYNFFSLFLVLFAIIHLLTGTQCTCIHVCIL